MKYDIKVLGFLLITLLAASCSKKKDAYNVSDSGLEYKYRQESKSGVYPQHGDKMLLRIMFYNAKDSLMLIHVRFHQGLLWSFLSLVNLLRALMTHML
jgi:uncharacterized membrane protein SpoIIM required for sporulation